MGIDAVRIANGAKHFGSTTAFRDVDVHVASGEFLAILGPSGSGKSTLLRVLAGLEELSAGTVVWASDGGRPRTGVVFQDPLLMPWLTVAENIAFAKRFAVHRSGFDDTYVQNLVQHFGLQQLADRYPDQLSGGQAQRVAILRAAATRPELLLLDEPFSALDPVTRADLQAWLVRLAGELSVTVVLVTHDVDEALALAHRVILLGDNGRIRQEWTLDDNTGEHPRIRAEILVQYQPIVAGLL
ncbi:ABC transporter ATP-binding protein [Mycobacteroides franklinii]|uniref:ABC transporter ATP-binding protein n=1 Tax=Mycobacteroides franklinii TaxID=948102 RepID=A0A4R8QXE0_9MYCO|nr:ABC transporter ATP-binding protein [Mycobacteroides franklinii]ORA58683.1 nitrate ABC transporter ATP-binding protein [Mycobacteroides franklinii]TDH24752.1 ABC transporter ATP-binding protein [Mycobacteroides franklinii]TDZ45076.1 Sulfate/thiosulfate import ATP-binding protein CysA [Mycobacteroides franklinii]TDZ48566.1 Sulfate/thiosulfate import ATP-binding protein CysA [Mycobacteroides franklinii]TDZ58746.1 Sulfate/thiosulfate import ATP-binding protein CysA [Mycobacteroides franklinii]